LTVAVAIGGNNPAGATATASHIGLPIANRDTNPAIPEHRRHEGVGERAVVALARIQTIC
jgi:hypothetical protein